MFAAILDYIGRTNLFNFVIFAGVFIAIYYFCDITGMLESGRKDIADKIEDSEKAKEEAEAGLQTLEEKVANLENEVGELIKKSEESANAAGQKIISDAGKTAENIQASTVKLEENKAALLKNDIIRRASLAAIETAKSHIVSELDSNKELHDRFIDESIEAINGCKYI